MTIWRRTLLGVVNNKCFHSLLHESASVLSRHFEGCVICLFRSAKLQASLLSLAVSLWTFYQSSVALSADTTTATSLTCNSLQLASYITKEVVSCLCGHCTKPGAVDWLFYLPLLCSLFLNWHNVNFLVTSNERPHLGWGGGAIGKRTISNWHKTLCIFSVVSFFYWNFECW